MDNIGNSEPEYESAPDDDGGKTKRMSEKPVFDIGKTVILVNKDQDIIDTQAVLINPVDSYVGKYLGQFFSTKVIGATLRDSAEETEIDDEIDGEDDDDYNKSRRSPKYWKILGTLGNPKTTVLPWLWAVMKMDDYDAYLREAVKCGVVIYDITEPSQERFEEIRGVLDALRSRVNNFNVPRVFILISSLHTWSHTKKTNQEDMFSEEDYRRRHTKPLYRELQLLERYVVAAGKMTKGKLKAYVVGAGAIYGAEESPLHHWFMSAWHNAKYLPIYGTGKNFMPTMYIQDLAKLVQNIMDVPPKLQRYLIAVDPVICQQDQIAKAISRVLGSGRVKRVSEEDIYLNKELTPFQADQHLLDLKIQSAYAMENFNMDFAAEDGFDSIINKVSTEYKHSRNLEPLKVVIAGPPASGKSTIARQISDLYRLNHFTKDDIIKTTLELLKETAGESPETDIQGVDIEKEEVIRKEALQVLAEVDDYLGRLSASLAEQSDVEMESEAETPGFVTPKKSLTPPERDVTKLSDEVFIRLVRWRLLTNQCQNQGFVLDGFPENLNQAKMLFAASEDVMETAEEDAEEGRDILDPRIVPDRVVVLEASDEFLTQRLQSVPAAQLQDKHKDKHFAKLLAEHRELNSVYETSFLYYLDLQEILYFPIDITTGDGLLMQNIIGKLMDMLGKPRNYGLTFEEEEAIKNAQNFEKSQVEDAEKEDMAMIESRELEERRANIQQWMEKLAKVKREEFEREEAALVPLRHYLMAHVVPTLTKGLIDVTRARPDDPVEYLAEFLFANNPGSLNTTLGEHFPNSGR
ncbi:unnamed protein product [Orchesella dallaii]|uniref:Adenylate kinase 7 n=1 Tax=Orchesella dallaii TaxID=48710 RepID=A0ABP1PNN8_9HEXA